MTDTRSDHELMAAWQGGDARAFEVLYARHRRSLYGFLVHQAGSAADDLFQEVWMTFIRQRDSWQPLASLRTFLFRIAHSRLVDHYRAQGRRFTDEGVDPDELADEGSCAFAMQEQQAQRRALEQCLADLPPEQREAFLFSEERELSLADIAAITGAGAETVKSRVRYAIRRLRACLRGLLGEAAGAGA
jgi:RNA polymerase sigma-70 factor (ECF subfamily)